MENVEHDSQQAGRKDSRGHINLPAFARIDMMTSTKGA